jgi:glycosyltransferase involved in cell wall biosynthesis
MKNRVSVVVCVRNEERRLARALDGIRLNDPDEIIVVDDDSTDATVEIARRYTDNVIISKAESLTTNRQLGIDQARNELIAMIDADHILTAGDIDRLVNDLHAYNFDMVQGQLMSYANMSIWNSAEEASWDLTHNIAGPKTMIGSAPVIYRKSIFAKVRFDGNITKNNDDADFVYRLSQQKELRFGVGKTKIRHLHFPELKTYLKKFMWYGHMDGEFVHKHPQRAHVHLFHLLIRYPIVYSGRALRCGRLRAIPFFVLQGIVRFVGLVLYFAELLVWKGHFYSRRDKYPFG